MSARVHHLHHVGAGLALNIEEQRLVVIGPSGEVRILRCLDDVRDLAQVHRHTAALGHQFLIMGNDATMLARTAHSMAQAFREQIGATS